MPQATAKKAKKAKISAPQVNVFEYLYVKNKLLKRSKKESIIKLEKALSALDGAFLTTLKLPNGVRMIVHDKRWSLSHIGLILGLADFIIVDKEGNRVTQEKSKKLEKKVLKVEHHP